jgi:hypothetical protein
MRTSQTLSAMRSYLFNAFQLEILHYLGGVLFGMISKLALDVPPSSAHHKQVASV